MAAHESRYLLKQIACGIGYLHDKKLIHRDIKPENIFLKSKTIGNGQITLVCKIGDFGLTTKVQTQRISNNANPFAMVDDEDEIEHRII